MCAHLRYMGDKVHQVIKAACKPISKVYRPLFCLDKSLGLNRWTDGAKGQVDARRSHTCHFRYRMQPIALQIAVHQNQLARRQGQFTFFAIDFVLEAKAPTRTQT